jgi:hypothetical protein
VYFTSPTIADTDGDGLSDGVEVNDLLFNAGVNNFLFNPRIADVPELDIQITNTPDLMVNLTTSAGGSTTSAVARTTATSQSVTTSPSAALAADGRLITG